MVPEECHNKKNIRLRTEVSTQAQTTYMLREAGNSAFEHNLGSGWGGVCADGSAGWRLS